MAMNTRSLLDLPLRSVRPADSLPARSASRTFFAPIALLTASLLAGGVASPASAQSVISMSPDVTIPLGAANVVTADHAVAVDNGLGVLVLENLGAIPQAADVIGYAEGAGGTKLLSFDTTVALAGGVVARPGDVVTWNGTSYSIAFSASQVGLPPGVRVDALAVASTGGLTLSFDTDVSLPGGLHVADEDLVRWSAGVFSLALDGSQAGLSRALDIDAADDLGGSTFLVSFDSAGSVGAISFADEDVLRRSNGTWTLERDLSLTDADWVAADLDAMQMVPEPAPGALLAVGSVFLAAAGGRPRRRRAAAMVQAIVLGAGMIAILVAPPAQASDGVFEIHQTCAVNGGCFPGDTAGFPVTITTSGSYRLSSNLTMPDAFTGGIVVNASNVSIDLNGFGIIGQIVCTGTPIACTPSPASGIGISNSNSFRFVRVRNGSIRGMGGDGVNLGSGSEVTALRVTANRGSGIQVWSDSIVSGNVVCENLLNGVTAPLGTVLTNNAIARNGSNGASDAGSSLFQVGVLASGNSVYQNQLDGLQLIEGAAVITGNTLYDNGDSGILAGDGTNVNGNTVVSNGGYGLSKTAGAVAYTDNVIAGNSTANVQPTSTIHNLGGNSCGGTATCP